MERIFASFYFSYISFLSVQYWTTTDLFKFVTYVMYTRIEFNIDCNVKKLKEQ